MGVPFKLDRGCGGFRQEFSRGGPACLTPESTHRWPVAHGFGSFHFCSDLGCTHSSGNIIFEVAEPPCLAGEEHRQRRKRKRDIRGLKYWGERQDNRARGEGCRSGQLWGSGPTSTWAGSEPASALGPQFLRSMGRKMKEVLGCSSRVEPGELPVYPITL